MLVTSLIVLNTALLLGMIVLLATFKRGLPDLLQGALNDVGGQLSEIFEKPQVQRAMSVLGKKSGEVRADAALKNKVASKVMGQNILLKKALDYFDITPTEGLELMADPMMGPILQRVMVTLSNGGQGLLKGFNNPGGNITRNSRGHIPNMS